MAGFSITASQLNDLVDFDKRGDLARQRQLLEAQGGMAGLLKALQTGKDTGIVTSPSEASRRQAAFGVNQPPPPKSVTFGELVWDAFQDRVLQILLVGAVITLVVGMIQDPATGWHEGISIVLTVGIVVGCNCGNDYWKEKKFQAILARAALKKCKVLRDSTEQVVWTTEVLVGDIVLLAQGDEVPADGLWLDGQLLVIDESALTGESDPFKKSAEKPSLFAGSLVTDNKARMLVTAVGSNTTGGKIMELLNSVAKGTTPLQEKLEKMAMDISKVAFVIALATWCGLLGWWVSDLANYGWQEGMWVRPSDGELVEGSLAVLVHDFVTVITLIVVAVPDGLPLATTLSLVFSMVNLIKRNNFVRNLAAAETMGQVTCICSDKTGTLTQNKMTVTRTWFAGKVVLVEGDATGARYSEDWKALAKDAIQANSTALRTMEADGSITVTGSKTEGALFKFLDVLKLKSADKYNKIVEVPFTSDRKRMTTVVSLGSTGRHRVFTKGAPEMLLPLCKDMYFGPGDVRPLTDSLRQEILSAITDFASLGLRTILAAYRDLEGVTSELLTPDELETGCTGLVVFGIEDPVRPEVPAAIKTCQGAGVTVRMCTGDNPFTAKKIAKDCGIWKEGVSVCLEGPVFRAMTDEERLAAIPSMHVLARSSPQDKFILVTALKRMGEVVAVTGDGTNDAPALREANIGFAMGIQGTDVAKNASDIVLLDDRFDSILQALLWGRNAYQCVIKFLQFQFAINLTSCLITLIAACANMGTPLNPVMLLWINLIMDTLGALAMSTEAPDPRVLEQPPRRKDEKVLTPNMIFYVLSESAWQLLVQFFVMFQGYKLFGFASDNKRGINTLVFNVNILMQLVNEFNGRHLQFTWDLCYGVTGNKTMLPILLLIAGVQFILVQLAYDFVDCVPLSGSQWLGCIIIAALGIPMGWVHQLGDLFGLTRVSARPGSPRQVKVHASENEAALLKADPNARGGDGPTMA